MCNRLLIFAGKCITGAVYCIDKISQILFVCPMQSTTQVLDTYQFHLLFSPNYDNTISDIDQSGND